MDRGLPKLFSYVSSCALLHHFRPAIFGSSHLYPCPWSFFLVLVPISCYPISALVLVSTVLFSYQCSAVSAALITVVLEAKPMICNRRQTLIHIRELSFFKNVKHGVPQGSVLRPIPFSIYINAIHYLSPAKCIRCTDDIMWNIKTVTLTW